MNTRSRRQVAPPLLPHMAQPSVVLGAPESLRIEAVPLPPERTIEVTSTVSVCVNVAEPVTVSVALTSVAVVPLAPLTSTSQNAVMGSGGPRKQFP